MDKEQFNQLATPTTPSISDLVQNVYEVRNVLFTAYPFLGDMVVHVACMYCFVALWGVYVVLCSVHVVLCSAM